MVSKASLTLIIYNLGKEIITMITIYCNTTPNKSNKIINNIRTDTTNYVNGMNQLREKGFRFINMIEGVIIY